MAENSSSAGQISLDLVIKSRIKEQLDKMRSSIQKPAEEIGKAMEDAISKPLKDTAQIVEKTLSEAAGNAADKVENAVGKAFDGAKKRAEKAVADIKDTIDDRGIDDAIDKWINENNKKQSENTVDLPNRVTEVRNPKDFGLDESAMKYLDEYEKKIDELAEKAEEPVKKLTEGLREKLGNFEVPSDPIERLSQEIENSYEKVGLLQKKWQELSAAEPSDKITSQLRNVESQIISTTKHIEGLESKLHSSLATAAGGANRASGSLVKLSGQTDKIKQKVSEIGTASKKAADTAEKSVKKTTGMFQKLGKSIKNAAKSVFLLTTVYALFRGIKETFETAIKGNEEFAKSLNEVKANLKVAFTPIVQAVMPALNRLMSGLAAATKYIASFISGLFGTTYKQALDATKKLNSVADTAKKVKMSTAGIDEMNILSSDSDSSSGADGIDYSALDEGDHKAENLGARVRKYLTSAFEAVGEKAREVFQKLSKWATVSFAPTFAGIWDGLKAETEVLMQTLSTVFSDICSLGEPLKEYFAGDFTVFLQTVFATLGDIVTGLFDTFNTVFSDIWNIAVFPIISSFITLGLPTITKFSTNVVKLFGKLFKEIKKIFDMLWEDVARPILTLIAETWQDLMELIADFWNKWGEPIFDKFGEAIERTGDTLRNIWNTILKPVFDKLMQTFDDIRNDHLKPLASEFLDFVGVLIDGALDIYNKFILPVVNWYVEKFGPPIAAVFKCLVEQIRDYVGCIIDTVNNIITALKGVVQFISGVFTGDWKKAWNGIKTFLQATWDSFVTIVKTPVNLIIDIINGLTQAVESAINWVINGINSISIDLPDVVADFVGFDSLGFNLSNIYIPDIPHLASGGLAYAPQLAMVGDNKNARNDPEVIAPLSKLSGMLGDNSEIVELLKIIVELLRNGMSIEIINYLFKGSREFSREVVKAFAEENARRGR